jgi:hypothetical protein
MADHELEHGQNLEPHTIQQVNQQRAKLGNQPFKTSQKFPAKTVQLKEETKIAQKETLVENIKLYVAQLQETAQTKTVPKQATIGPKQLKDTEMVGIYHNVIVSTISKLNTSFKKPFRPYVSLLMNAHRLCAL